MNTFCTCVFSKVLGPYVSIRPPEDLDLYNFALVPTDRPFKGWIDPEAGLESIELPSGTRWVFSVHVVETTGEDEPPLQCGRLIAGPLTSLKDAERVAWQVESSGWFVCVFAALVTDKSALN